MIHARYAPVECLVLMLQDERVRTTIHVQDRNGFSALARIRFSLYYSEGRAAFSVHLLLRAGANPLLMNKQKHTPVACLREVRPSYHAAFSLFEEFPDAKQDSNKSFILMKGRRLAVIAASNAPPPSYLQGRAARGQPLPRVALSQMPGNQDEGGRKLRRMVAFLLGMEGGPEGEGMPRDVFRVVLDLLMPSWDPLRRGIVGDGREVLSD